MSKNLAAAKNKDQSPVINSFPLKTDIQFPSWLVNFKVQAIILAIISFVFYLNTYQNEYALDDTIILVQNEYVLEGVSGIPDILTKDAFDSYYKRVGITDQLTGGRYRPLSFISFAIEQQFFGAIPKEKADSIIRSGYESDPDNPYRARFLQHMHFRHVFNVLWYTLSVIVLLYFLRYLVFKNNPVMAFMAALIFTIHPIHTEVVANVKSRDEIMSLLFICLTFIFAFKYRENRKKWLLGAGLFTYFLALLSKEYAVTLIALLPIAFYVLNGYSVKKSLVSTLPYLPVLAIYILMRMPTMHPHNELAENDFQINPYTFASGSEKLATEISTSLRYIKLLLFPHPLSSDYSYNQIPYSDFSNPIVWLSMLIHTALVGLFFYFLSKRNVLSIALAFYLFNLLMVCNMVFDIGATMGERLIYHSSVGFAIIAAYLLYKGIEKIKPVIAGKLAMGGFMLLLIVLCGYKTITRNRDWKNDETLFFQDINVSPNSFLVNANVATILVNNSDFERDEQKRIAQLHRGISLFNKVIGMQNTYTLGYLNRAIGYLKLNQPDSLIDNLNAVRNLYPIHPQLPQLYYYAGEAYAGKKQFGKADTAWRTALQLNPGYFPAQRALYVLDSMSKLEKTQ